MKARKYTEEQIIAVLREAEAGARVVDLCRKYGMSDATYYNCKAKYAGLTVSELKRLKRLASPGLVLPRRSMYRRTTPSSRRARPGTREGRP